ncbi:MAG: biotin/lipoyl-binding protein [Mariprofundus sp.]|nr:biotin/lipoyl-binding protein [Mariprofundus sp.]
MSLSRWFIIPLLLFVQLASSGCNQTDIDYYQGYIEGDYLQLSAEHSGRIEQLNVVDGQHVEHGMVLATLLQDHEKATVAQAKARFEQSMAILDDLSKGGRGAEIKVLEASLGPRKE